MLLVGNNLFTPFLGGEEGGLGFFGWKSNLVCDSTALCMGFKGPRGHGYVWAFIRTLRRVILIKEV